MIGKAYWILNGKMWQQTWTSCCESSLFAFPGYTNPAISKFHSMMPRHCALLIPTSTILESARRSPGFKGPGVARAESVWAASKPVNSEGPRACGMPACSELALVPLEKLTKNSPMFCRTLLEFIIFCHIPWSNKIMCRPGWKKNFLWCQLLQM